MNAWRCLKYRADAACGDVDIPIEDPGNRLVEVRDCERGTRAWGDSFSAINPSFARREGDMANSEDASIAIERLMDDRTMIRMFYQRLCRRMELMGEASCLAYCLLN